MEKNEISLEDVKDKTEQLKEAAARALSDSKAQVYLGSLLVVAAAVGLSYLIGKRRGRASVK